MSGDDTAGKPPPMATEYSGDGPSGYGRSSADDMPASYRVPDARWDALQEGGTMSSIAARLGNPLAPTCPQPRPPRRGAGWPQVPPRSRSSTPRAPPRRPSPPSPATDLSSCATRFRLRRATSCCRNCSPTSTQRPTPRTTAWARQRGGRARWWPAHRPAGSSPPTRCCACDLPLASTPAAEGCLLAGWRCATRCSGGRW